MIWVKASQRKGGPVSWNFPGFYRGYGYDVQPGQAVSYGSVPDLVGLPDIHIECKRNERMNVLEAMKQAVRDAAKFGGTPALFHRRNRSGWLVTMRLPDWMEMYQKVEKSST